jgi:hypothetical protein
MNSEFFESQIRRLVAVYGEKAYPKERVRVFWNAMNELSNQWLERTVDHFVAYEQYAPLMEKWQDQISREREMIWKAEKKAHAKDAKEFASRYSSEDISTICNQIQQRIRDGMSDQNFAAFKKMLTPPEVKRCNQCDGQGVYLDELGGNTVCWCYRKSE